MRDIGKSASAHAGLCKNVPALVWDVSMPERLFAPDVRRGCKVTDAILSGFPPLDCEGNKRGGISLHPKSSSSESDKKYPKSATSS